MFLLPWFGCTSPPKHSDLRREHHSYLSTKMRCGEGQRDRPSLTHSVPAETASGLESPELLILRPGVGACCQLRSQLCCPEHPHVASPRGLGFQAVQWGFQRWAPWDRDPGKNTLTLCDLALEVLEHPFHDIFFINSWKIPSSTSAYCISLKLVQALELQSN